MHIQFHFAREKKTYSAFIGSIETLGTNRSVVSTASGTIVVHKAPAVIGEVSEKNVLARQAVGDVANVHGIRYVGLNDVLALLEIELTGAKASQSGTIALQ